MDVLISTNGGPAYLLHNETPTANHWLTVKLIGKRSNRDGIGAMVTSRAGEQTQRTMVRSGSSYLSASDHRAHFGFGSATHTDVEVKWPSGVIDQLTNIQA